MKKRLSALLASLLLAGTTPSHAAFRASPVRIYLGPEARSELVTLSNHGDRTVRLQVVAQAWSESPLGEQLLAPTDELVVFPSLLTLGPGESRQVRVGVVGVPATREATYRVIVTELPEPDLPGAPHGVVIRTRLSLPVFATPAAAVAHPRVTDLVLGPDGLDFTLVNDGTRHARVGALEVTFEDPKGKTAPTTIEGWYLLSGGRRDYHVALPALGCVAHARVVVPVEIGVDESTRLGSEAAAPARCAR